MTGPGFEVDAAELHEFAKGQRARQDALDAAASKAAGVDLGGDTFGQLLSFFAIGAQQFAQETTAAIRELAAAAGNASDDTTATARTYESYEDANRNRFGGPR
ncbi:Excreted virulence factor EspC, type VII ESX diderm [Lentzea xinjiangensis]|uniref:Excreted virulence factor EspC, type VII ESX diderm n=1 Tax=Lentzea xinjiangensis TaxID=402600 RepID=A0A1H9MFI1_9PSEU|nr:type VII secretion target [Lentzea xinjiangensis]SER22321.1 Excreted virulence factor EspC, type VII ESX diderm [Lentzea xinjiangensis]